MTDQDIKVSEKKARRIIVDNCLDTKFKGGRVDKYFKVTERGSNLTTEIRAGTTTFLTSAYIMAVNPNILSVTGLNFEGLIFATAFSSCVATIIIGMWGNLPFGIYPGMGTNAYVAYTLVAFKGSGQAVKKVMFAITMEGVAFIVLSLVDARRVVYKVFPTFLMKATMAGIGLFLAFIGLQAGNGIDIIRANPAVLVDLVTLSAEHCGRTWIGIASFCFMALLVTLKVKGAVMIGILASTFFCWILEAGGTTQLVYQPMCCLGTMTYPMPVASMPDTMGFYPKPGGGWLPKPTCVNPFTVPGEAVWEGSGKKKTTVFKGSTVAYGAGGSYVVTTPGQATVNHSGSLLFKGNAAGRDSSFKGACDDACHSMFGGFNPACFGSTLVSTTCWSGMDYQDRAEKKVLVDGFGEGCIGGAGRIPKTFQHPVQIVAAPKAELAGDIVEPYPGFFGCDYGPNQTLLGCWAGDVDGGSIWAFDTDGLTFANFWSPFITLLWIDFVGNAGFLYSIADLCGLVNPERPDNFPGCYAAFMSDAIGTVIGGILGTSSLTSYGESMAGIYEGGRTGLTAMVIAFWNFICIFFGPLFASIPTISTGPALIMVGVFMIEGVKDIDWTDYMQAIPSVVCVLLMVCSYHIEYGIFGGFVVWAFMMICSLRIFAFIPAVWPYLPPVMRRFIASQDGDSTFKKAIDKCEGKNQKNEPEKVVEPEATSV